MRFQGHEKTQTVKSGVFKKKTPFSEVSVRRFKGVSYALNLLGNERYNL